MNQTINTDGMNPVYERANRLVGCWLVLQWAVLFGLSSSLNRTVALEVGIGLTIPFLLGWHYWPAARLTRIWVGIMLQGFCALFIWEAHGMAEQHFWFFTATAIMIAYKDWFALWPGVLLIIAQHLFIAVAVAHGHDMNMFFEASQVGVSKFAWHFGIALVQAALCSYCAWTLRQRHQALMNTHAILERTSKELAEQTRRASLSVLAGGIAHDFNNILMGVLGNAALVRMDCPPQMHPTLQDIEDAAMRAGDLAKQMLAYAGRGKTLIEPLNMTLVVSDISRLLQSAINKHAHLVLDLHDGLPAVDADVTQMRQVVMNLITNASDALAEHDGNVTIRTLKVENEHGTEVLLEVVDTGCGMDQATIDRIYDPFFTTKAAGRGLGLSAVQGIVNQHGGRLEVSSAVGVGTTFRLFLPAIGAPGTSGVNLPVPIGTWRGTGAVLIVDDDAVVRDVASRFLRRLGFTPIAATGCRTGLQALARENGRVRAILLDFMMPEMNGPDMLDILRERYPTLPVILCSGYNETEAVRRCPGIVGFLQKPYSIEQLGALLKATLTPKTEPVLYDSVG